MRIVLSCLLLAACAEAERMPIAPAPTADAGAVADAGPADTGEPVCHAADLTCPSVQPFAGGPCEGALRCTYSEANGQIRWITECTGGAWATTCEADFPGGCSFVPMSEYCNSPFPGLRAGASVEIGPPGAGPFASFARGEEVRLEWGPQGLPMVGFRIAMEGADDLRCVNARATFHKDGTAMEAGMSTVTMRCGRSLKVLAIVPFDAFEARHFDVGFDVTVVGVGTATTTLGFMGGR